MKKEVKQLLILLVLFTLPLVASSTFSDDFKSQTNRVASYANDYETGNINYAQLLVYTNAVEDDANSLLRATDKITLEKDLTTFLGLPDQTSWILSEDGINQIQSADSVPIWKEVIIFDGSTIQLKINVIPVLINNQDVIYKAQFLTVVKEVDSSLNFNQKISDIKKLAQIFNLNPGIQTANQLAEEAVNTEKLFPSYFEQNKEKCEDLMTKIFGQENLVSKKGIVVKNYEIYNKGGYDSIASLHICEDCKGADEKSIDLQMTLQKNVQDIAYTTVADTSKTQFSDLTINQIKTEFIGLNSQLSKSLDLKDYQGAYTIGKQMQSLNSIWNEKANQGDSSELAKNFVDRTNFYKGLFDGYKLTSTSYYEETKFSEPLVMVYKNNSEEICNNHIDDNNDTKIDCQDSLCEGQICGSEIVNTTIGNSTTQNNVELYCIEQKCQEKQNQTIEIKTICGDGKCDTGEEQTCKKDCIKCPTYPPLQCQGKVIFSGQDDNGCQLAPICIKDKNQCSIDNDCEQPTCGTSQCVSGTCTITKLDQCSQKECTDGETKVSMCKSNETIITQICINGLWKLTGLKCQQNATEDSIPLIGELSLGGCKLKTDCAADNVCQLGKCIAIPQNTKNNAQPATQSPTKGISVTGNIIDITGEYITGTGITTVIGDNPDLSTPVNEKTVPQRAYPTTQTTSHFTGIVKSSEGATVPDFTDQDFLKTTSGSVELNSGLKSKFVAEGTCTTKNQKTEASIIFSGSGEKFGPIDDLEQKYREKGIAWCDWQLKELLDQRKKIVESFNEQNFAPWFDQYLAYNADFIESKKQAIYGIYNEIIQNQINIALMMDCLNLNKLSNYDLININYESQDKSFALQYSEQVKTAQLAGMQGGPVNIIYPSLQTRLFSTQDVLEKKLVTDMNALKFPGSSVSTEQRTRNKGLTDAEILKFNNDQALKDKIKAVTKNLKDGYIDVQITFVKTDSQGNQIPIYNMYAKINEDNVFFQPMSVDQIPPAVDTKITVGFQEMYNLLDTSEKNKEVYTLHPTYDTSFKPIDMINTAIRGINTRLKMNAMMSSIQVSPDKPELKSIFQDFVILIGEDPQSTASSQ
jgi:hypothetical protein